LCIGEASVLSWINEACDINQVARTDRRGRKAKEDSSAKLKHVTDFLDKIPKMESHYCRQSTSKEYFEVNYQSLKQVYKEFEKHFEISNLPNERNSNTTGLELKFKERILVCLDHVKINVIYAFPIK